MRDVLAITLDDRRYPEALRRIADAPSLLYIRGNPEALVRPLMLAVVGTRKVTRYGLTATRLLAGGLAAAGACVVSGLALGTDAEAHESALAADGVTVAVLAGGVDAESVAPKSNFRLAERIVERGGALVSEWPPGTATFPSEFLRRNRIIAGLCRGTIVAEAAVRSGALVTARAALDENRDVFAVPGPITSVMSEGTNALIARGAVPALSAGQILEHYGATQLSLLDDATADPVKNDTVKLLSLLRREPLPLDAIGPALGIDERDARTLVTTLELDGKIDSRGGVVSLHN